ncbi:MAG: hypothetical protein P8Z80_06470 [Pseudolabrys sp.]|jgi:hypothetical protein
MNERARCRMARSSLIAFIVATTISASASAHRWQYCLAPSFADSKFYVSTPFPARDPLSDTERAYVRVLSRAGLRYSDVQCPAAEGRRRIADMRRHALNLNRELGMSIVPLPLNEPLQAPSIPTGSLNN